MPDSTPVTPTPPRKREIILCSKCAVENLAGATRCHECGAHLYLACRQCGQANLRSLKRCTHCGGRLGRSFMHRLKDKVFRRFSVMETLLILAVFAGIVLGVVKFIETMSKPEPEAPATPVYEHTVPTKDPSKEPQGAEPAPKMD